MNMDIHNNNNIKVNTVHSQYCAEHAPVKASANKSKTNTSPDSAPMPVKDTRLSFSVEKDIGVVVTTVVDTNTKQVLRQLPSEEAIKRLKLLKAYHTPGQN